MRSFSQRITGALSPTNLDATGQSHRAPHELTERRVLLSTEVRPRGGKKSRRKTARTWQAPS